MLLAVTLPVVYLDGEAIDQGRQHGLSLRDQIAHNLEVYFDRFQTEARLSPAEVRERAAQYLPLLREYADYFASMEGIAETSGQDLLDVAVLNMRYELLYYQYSILPVSGPDGCTSFGLQPAATADHHLLLGENWDWIPEVAGAVVHTHNGDFETLSFTEAGVVGGKIGLNSAGLGLAINGLLSTADDWSRQVMPFHVRCYEILMSRDFDSAANVICAQPRACSANFVIAQAPDRIVNVEAAPDAVCELQPVRGAVVHTNHFVDPARLCVEEPSSERRPHSYIRLGRLRELLEARRPTSVADLQASLRDHDNYPDSVCRHIHPDDPPEEACTTVVSAVMDLHERTLWLTDGPPCEHVYERYELEC